ncbi:hypothetical protein HJFPF1_04995 [Paramyrothecium foliicola]|nr:hypothetical protein HJFPF1_04995 [Paramyrothecium foliicola]
MDFSKGQQKDEGEKEFSIQPIKDKVEDKFSAFSGNPGPARTNDMPAQEGSKEERRAKKEELNK